MHDHAARALEQRFHDHSGDAIAVFVQNARERICAFNVARVALQADRAAMAICGVRAVHGKSHRAECGGEKRIVADGHSARGITVIAVFKRDDFQLWVTDSEGNPAAVTPVAPRGSGVSSVHVQYATPGSQLALQKQQQESAGGALILPGDHPLAQQAFQNQ